MINLMIRNKDLLRNDYIKIELYDKILPTLSNINYSRSDNMYTLWKCQPNKVSFKTTHLLYFIPIPIVGPTDPMKCPSILAHVSVFRLMMMKGCGPILRTKWKDVSQKLSTLMIFLYSKLFRLDDVVKTRNKCIDPASEYGAPWCEP